MKKLGDLIKVELIQDLYPTPIFEGRLHLPYVHDVVVDRLNKEIESIRIVKDQFWTERGEFQNRIWNFKKKNIFKRIWLAIRKEL